MEITQEVFKAYDIRGTYPDEVNQDLAFRVGQAYVQYAGANSVIVGRDMRTSSPELFDALVEGLTLAGVDVVDVGLVSTPEFYFAVASGDYDGGIMVTASHNPAKYNGLKVVGRGAMPMGKESGLEDIKKIVLRGEKISKPKGNVIETDVLEEYVDKIFSRIDPKDIDSKLRVLIDTGSGMAGVVEPDLWKRLKNKSVIQCLELDGNFRNHEANPMKKENVRDTSDRIKKEKFDIGIAFDGDGDRVGFLDERGELIRGDLILALIAPEILRAYPGAPILYDTRCSMVLGEEISRAGGKPVFSKVGHALVKHQMREIGAAFGGELSMHYYFRDFPGIECPDLVMLHVLRIMSERKKKLSELIAPLARYHHSGEINFTVENKEAIVKKIEQKLSKEAINILRLDGLRMEFGKNAKDIDWWLSLRLSNTEPLLRLNLEARLKDVLGEKQSILKAIIESK